MRTPEKCVGRHAFIEVSVESSLEDIFLMKAPDDVDSSHRAGGVVDYRRFHHAVQLLSLKYTRVHRQVQHYKNDGNEDSSNDEVGEENTYEDDL